MSAETVDSVTSRPIPLWVRFYLYGMHGFLDEIIFTSLFDFFNAPHGEGWHLKGHSSIYSFFIYGTCSMFVERLYLRLHNHIPTLPRAFMYIFITYFWEFTSGLILRQLDACPWDYSHYPYNFMGLITLEYAPAWFVLCLWQDILSDFLLRLRVHENKMCVN